MKPLNQPNIIIASAFLLGFTGIACASESTAELAAGLLAKSQAIDTKCNFLTSAEHDEISNLVAKAEIALTRRVSVAATKRLMARNAEKGKNGQCSEAERADVLNILAAAKTAAIAKPMVVKKPTAMSMVAQKPILIQPRPMIAKSVATMPPPKKPMPVVKVIAAKTQTGLANYASITERYYLARRCGNMSARAIIGFYGTVVSSHRQVLSSFGRRAVASVMRQAETRAASKSCS